MRKPQIGVIGSTSDLNYAKDVEKMAERVGELVEAQRGTERRVDELAQGLRELAEAQRRTEGRVDGLAPRSMRSHS